MGLWLAQHAEFIGHAKVRGHLYQVSYYPAVVDGHSWIEGDVYACAADLWPILDEFEEVNTQNPEYERRLTPVLLTTGQWLTAWVYWYLQPTAKLQRLY